MEWRDYVGGIEYLNNGLESIAHTEGRIYYGGGTTQRFDYVITDHLGNTRLLYSDLDLDGIPEVPDEIIQEEHYYPFGMKMVGPWMAATTGSEKTKYTYNGIEHVEAFDLNVNMAMYRTLDPSTGRWWSVDPKAESFVNLTPYNSMGNSPMNFADPAGDEPITIGALAIGALIGAGTQTASHLIQNNFTFRNWNWGTFAGSIVAGGVAAGLGSVLEASRIGGFAGGAMLGGATGLSSSLTSSIINPGFSLNSIVSSTLTGAGAGGLLGGLSTGKGYRFWDGRSNFPVERYQLANGINPITEGSPNKVTGQPRMSLEEAIARGEVGYMGDETFVGRLGTANPKVRNINAGFGGKLHMKGNAYLVEGTEFYVNVDGKDIISTRARLRIDMKISSGAKNISWGIRGKPIVQATTQGNLGFQASVSANSYIYITGKHRGWNGFLWWGK